MSEALAQLLRLALQKALSVHVGLQLRPFLGHGEGEPERLFLPLGAPLGRPLGGRPAAADRDKGGGEARCHCCRFRYCRCCCCYFCLVNTEGQMWEQLSLPICIQLQIELNHAGRYYRFPIHPYIFF